MPNPKRSSRRLPQPQQVRSRHTRERIIRAAEELLAQHDFRGMLVRQIAARAHTSVGAFYKHFPGKRDLLPVLLDREQSAVNIDEMESTFMRLADVPLAERVAWLVGFVASTTTRRRNVLRACVAARYATELTLSPIQVARSRDHLHRIHAWLLQCKDEIAHHDRKMAVRVGVYLALQSLQTALLFEQLPADLPPRRLIVEAQRMLLNYLTDARHGPAMPVP